MKQLLRKIGIVAGTVAITGLTAPLIVPLPPLEGTVPPESLADPTSKFIQTGRISIRYKRLGEKKPFFLLLHGYLRTLYTWEKVFKPLSEMGSPIAYDRPAFGLTSRPMPGDWKGHSPYGYRAQAEMAIQFMDALELDQTVMIGHGMGAHIAMLAAELFPKRVDRLILVAPNPGDRGRPAWQRLFMATPQMRRLGPVMLRSRVAHQIEDMLHLSWYDPARIPAEMKEEYERLLLVNDWDRALWELARATESLDKVISPENIRVPTLVMAAEKDDGTDTERTIRLAAEIPHAHLALIPETGHAPQEETPLAFVQAIREFLETPDASLPAAEPPA